MKDKIISAMKAAMASAQPKMQALMAQAAPKQIMVGAALGYALRGPIKLVMDMASALVQLAKHL